MTTGSHGLEGAGDVLKSILGDEPAQPVLGCCLWPRGKANVGKTTITQCHLRTRPLGSGV